MIIYFNVKGDIMPKGPGTYKKRGRPPKKSKRSKPKGKKY